MYPAIIPIRALLSDTLGVLTRGDPPAPPNARRMFLICWLVEIVYRLLMYDDFTAIILYYYT